MESNFKDLEEANKEIEQSKVVFHNTEKTGDKKDEELVEENKNSEDVKEQQGSGIFTADGEELPEIEGGYDIVDPGGTLGDDEFVS